MAHLIDGGWIDRHENLLITGPTGLGKSWIACALGHKTCRDGPVAIDRHGKPRLVMLTTETFQRMQRSLDPRIARRTSDIPQDEGMALITELERLVPPE